MSQQSTEAKIPFRLSETQRADHRRRLLELTSLPTAAGREGRVERYVEAWAAQLSGLELSRDSSGNIHIKAAGDTSAVPLVIEAHLDHPAFVVERVLGPATLQVAFRGGVMDDYFDDAAVEFYEKSDERGERPIPGRIISKIEGEDKIAKRYEVELTEETEALAAGDIGRWCFDPPEIDSDGVIWTHACDNLASVAGAMSAMEALLDQNASSGVRLLFTRAEEIGFIGAIGACREGSLPNESRVIVLETSRSFADSPIGGGPILRVGDRISVFSPGLTAAVGERAKALAGKPAEPLSTQKRDDSGWRWQRKLMAGGACEASVFTGFGYEATCVCLPLGNYHNMADLDAVQAGTNTDRPRVGREHVSVADSEGMVELLVACGLDLDGSAGFRSKIDELYAERSFVLVERDA
ncbi:MAG: hypothetical protein AAGB51_10055 [Planctomycetota bacterium]